jgi:O-antigen/teichoic acid export membrane protein
VSSLKQKTVKGLSWSLIDNISNKGITFLVGIVLARLLSPEEFGVIGMITIFISLSYSIVDSGFSNALIRKKNADRIDYNTVFIINFLLGISLYFILFLCSPAISSFFNEPLLIPVTRLLGIVLIINSFSIIQRTILVKNIDFKTKPKFLLFHLCLAA